MYTSKKKWEQKIQELEGICWEMKELLRIHHPTDEDILEVVQVAEKLLGEEEQRD